MQIVIEPTKTYASEANAIKAVNKALSPEIVQSQRWMIVTHSDGRFYPLFIGERAIQAGVHFHFNVVN